MFSFGQGQILEEINLHLSHNGHKGYIYMYSGIVDEENYLHAIPSNSSGKHCDNWITRLCGAYWISQGIWSVCEQVVEPKVDSYLHCMNRNIRILKKKEEKKNMRRKTLLYRILLILSRDMSPICHWKVLQWISLFQYFGFTIIKAYAFCERLSF